MSNMILDPCLVIVLALNFYILSTKRLRPLIKAVAVQGVLLGFLYPVSHYEFSDAATSSAESSMPFVLRLLLLTAAIVVIKGWLIPKLLFRAVRMADIRLTVTSIIGFIPTVLLGAAATMAALLFARTLPLLPSHQSYLLVPASLATVMTGFILLTTRREAIAQVLGYIVLENGLFIFGLMLIEAVPLLVEFGVVLDLFVGVFVMGIAIHHVSRVFPEASSEHMTALRE